MISILKIIFRASLALYFLGCSPSGSKSNGSATNGIVTECSLEYIESRCESLNEDECKLFIETYCPEFIQN